MSQRDYDLICEIIETGAPALSQRLITSLSNLINDYQNKTKELENIKLSSERSEDK